MRQTKMSFNEHEKQWYVVDATDLVLGRMSTEIAKVLTGKNKTIYTPNQDYGDYVIITNAKKVILTGDKLNKKLYYSHSGWPGGLRVRNAKTMQEKYPEEMVYKAIWGMIPHNKLGRQQIKKLFIYPDATHKHEAQQPEILEIKTAKKR